MNNTELLLKFQDIMDINNPLEQVCALKQMRKIYKKSMFYKTTRINIYKAYEMACKMLNTSLIVKINNLLDEEQLSDFINNTIETIHLDVLINNLLRSVNYEHLSETLTALVPDLDTTQLQELINRLKDLTDKK